MNLKQLPGALLRGASATWKHFIRRPWMRPFDDYCLESKAKIVSSGLMPSRRAELVHGPLIITLQCDEGDETPQTIASAVLNLQRPVSFSIAPSGLFLTRAKALILPRFYSGYRPFDDEVTVFGADLPELARMLSDEKLRLLLSKHKDVQVSLTNQPKHESFKMTLCAQGGKHLLSLHVADNLTSLERYRDLIELTRQLLDQFLMLDLVVLDPQSTP